MGPARTLLYPGIIIEDENAPCMGDASGKRNMLEQALNGNDLLFIIDKSGVEKNRPGLDLIKKIRPAHMESAWYDAGCRNFTSTIDAVTAGAVNMIVNLRLQYDIEEILDTLETMESSMAGVDTASISILEELSREHPDTFETLQGIVNYGEYFSDMLNTRTPPVDTEYKYSLKKAAGRLSIYTATLPTQKDKYPLYFAGEEKVK